MSVNEAFKKDFPQDYETMNNTYAPTLARCQAEAYFNVYRKGWEAAKRDVYGEPRRHRGAQRVRQLIQAGKEHDDLDLSVQKNDEANKS